MKKVSTKVWVIILAVIFGACAAFTGYVYYLGTRVRETPPPVGPVAAIYVNGELVDAVDLGTVEENYTKTYEGADGAENTVEFAPGQARMEHSTCPDQICVGMGWQDGSWPLPIACLPNNVIIYIVPVEEPEESPAVTPGLDGAVG